MRETAPLTGSMLSRASYDPTTRTLDLTFRSGTAYTFEGVPQEVFDGLRNADSPGQYYHQNIKGQY